MEQKRISGKTLISFNRTNEKHLRSNNSTREQQAVHNRTLEAPTLD